MPRIYRSIGAPACLLLALAPGRPASAQLAPSVGPTPASSSGIEARRPSLLDLGGPPIGDGVIPPGTGPAATGSPGVPTIGSRPPRGAFDRLRSPFSPDPDADGPIDTDRPSFTPSNALVPRDRLQVESGYTFTSDRSEALRSERHLFPELAVRYGLFERVELRTYWAGWSIERLASRVGPPTTRQLDGSSDFLAGFKWKLSDQRRWIPKASLITDLAIPTGDASPTSSDGVEPVLFLLYGWRLTDRLALAGSTGYTSFFDRGVGDDARLGDSYEQYSQSFIGFFDATDRLIVFYEWFLLARTNAADNRPEHFMDGGLLFRPTPNLQLDLRVGFGLGDRPADIFAGAGVAVRY